jgi:hypothetical protein
MIHELRVLHFRTFVALGIVLPAGIAAGLAARDATAPVSRSDDLFTRPHASLAGRGARGFELPEAAARGGGRILLYNLAHATLVDDVALPGVP